MMARKIILRITGLFILIFLFLNLIAALHAYRFTHFDPEPISKTNAPNKLSASEKLKTLLFGVNNPRPENNSRPQQAYQTLSFIGDKKLEAWLIPTENSQGTVVLFHGFGG